MQVAGFYEAVQAIVVKDPSYRAEGYVFLRDSLEATIKRRRKNRKEMGSHLSAAELLEGFRILALKEFGPMALTVLEYWGISHCADIGRMVFHLVETGAFGKTDNDTIESFSNVFDFEQVFVVPFQPVQATPTSPPCVPSP